MSETDPLLSQQGPAALLAALEADSAEPFERLVQRNGLVVTAEVVDCLLAPREGASLWRTIVLQKGKQAVVESLVGAHERLRDATLTSEMLVAALTPRTTSAAMWILGENEAQIEPKVSVPAARGAGALVLDGLVHLSPAANQPNATVGFRSRRYRGQGG